VKTLGAEGWTLSQVIWCFYCKGKANPEVSRRLGFSDVKSQHMKLLRLSALSTGRLYPTGNIPGSHFRQRLCPPQDHSAAGRIMSMKYFNDTIGNRVRDFPGCIAVPQPTAPLGAPVKLAM
jgi:hypothetical protein